MCQSCQQVSLTATATAATTTTQTTPLKNFQVLLWQQQHSSFRKTTKGTGRNNSNSNTSQRL